MTSGSAPLASLGIDAPNPAKTTQHLKFSTGSESKAE
jgi:hypothetical protein